MPTHQDKFQLEALLKNSWDRTIERFPTYFLSICLSILLMFVYILGCLLLAGAVGGVYFITKSLALVFTVGFVAFVAAFTGLMYMSSWIQLTMFQAIASPKKAPIMQIVQEMRPLVWKFLGVSLLIGLFFIGLFPFFIMSFGIVLVYWSIAACFLYPIFLNFRKGGLLSLWLSQKMISGRFWAVFGRFLILGILAVMISGVIISVMTFSQDNILSIIISNLLSIVFQLFWTPFTYAFAVEMYEALPQPQVDEIEPPKVWLVLSYLGGIAVLFFFGTLVVYGVASGLQMFERTMNMNKAPSYNQMFESKFLR